MEREKQVEVKIGCARKGRDRGQITISLAMYSDCTCVFALIIHPAVAIQFV